MNPRAWPAALVLTLLLCPAAVGQAPETAYCRNLAFRIPFQIDPGEIARQKEVQLFLLDEPTRQWKPVKTVTPEQRHFSFRAERDGAYQFLVRTVDTEGKFYPPVLEGAPPGLRVIVDTVPPQATLRALAPRGDQVGVAWDVRDENLDVATLNLEFRGQNAGEWMALTLEPAETGQKYWVPPVRGPLEVRLRVRDKAENPGTAYLLLPNPAGGGFDAGARRDGGHDSGYPRAEPGGKPPIRVVNTAEISLNYKLEDVGPSGVSSVELFLTRDGRTWSRLCDDPDKESPITATLPGEGLFGLTLVVKSGVGLGDKPPLAGDPPQMWIEVDLTKPVVKILNVEAGRGPERGQLLVTWKAEDKNLTAQPISLAYAEKADGPWVPMASGLENTGRYVWSIPQANTPYKFFVKVEAVDKGGNVGRDQTKEPVAVDLSLPRARLLDVEPTGEKK
jgi:hypothetical protein